MATEEIRRSPDGREAWVASVLMGLGHMRAAYPLKDIAAGGIIIEGEDGFSPADETRIWKSIRNAYYAMSTAERIPLVGKSGLWTLNRLLEIPSFYPRRDLSRPGWAVRYLSYLVRKRGLGRTLAATVEGEDIPLISTFYAPAVAADLLLGKKDNYLVICDTDCNRIWVPEDPRASALRYLVPCSRVKKRLLSYGVPAASIFITGFPLPKENIGTRERQEVLKGDLFNRLHRLDPERRFFGIHEETVLHFLGREAVPPPDTGGFTLTFAVGGAGAQSEMGCRVLRSLAAKIREGRIRVCLSAGIQKGVRDEFMRHIDGAGLSGCLGDGVRVIYDRDVYRYLEEFNRVLRGTDVLWTKPSELSFYCALGIPILMAPPIGPQERQNRKWLQAIHAGIVPPGGPDCADEWLFDLRDSGALAEAAWDGYLKARKLGTYKIEELVCSGRLTGEDAPPEQ